MEGGRNQPAEGVYAVCPPTSSVKNAKRIVECSIKHQQAYEAAMKQGLITPSLVPQIRPLSTNRALLLPAPGQSAFGAPKVGQLAYGQPALAFWLNTICIPTSGLHWYYDGPICLARSNLRPVLSLLLQQDQARSAVRRVPPATFGTLGQQA